MSAITDPNLIQAFRWKTILRGIQMEAKTGLKMTRGKSCLAIAKAELGFGRNAARDTVTAAVQRRITELESAAA